MTKNQPAKLRTTLIVLAKQGLRKSRLTQAGPQTTFVALAGVFGLLFLMVTPPMQVPDESEHLYRAYQVSQFNVLADPVDQGFGGSLPTSVIKAAKSLKESTIGQPYKRFDTALSRKAWHMSLQPAQQTKIRFDNTAIYSPVSYLPQAFGIGVARVLHFNPLAIIYMGRIANLLVWIVLIYAAIRLTPVGKWAFAVIALNPMALFLAASLSPDAMIIGLVAVLLATVLRLRTVKTAIDKRLVVLLAVLVLMVCLTKNAYLPLALLVFLIPSRVVGFYYKAGIAAGSLAVGVAWNAVILPIAQNITKFFGQHIEINTNAQLSGILHDPVGYAQILGNALVGRQSSAVLPSYSGVFGWLDTASPLWLSFLYIVLLAFVFLYRDEAKQALATVTVKVRVLAGVLIVASTVMLLTSLYAGYNAVGASFIEGIQGRYFIPLTFLVVPLLVGAPVAVVMTRKTLYWLVPSVMTIILGGSIITQLVRYY